MWRVAISSKNIREPSWEENFLKVNGSRYWSLSESDSNINPILRLSYHNLPSNLKRCFAYCSIFPKGYKFNKNKLINLWMAEGLLKFCGGDESEEELGNKFFDDLESISFVQEQPYLWGDKRFLHA